MANSTIRLSGMASGLDTDSVVEQLMNAEKQKTYKVQREQTKVEWKIEKYREVTTKLNDFSKKYLDVLSSTNMKSGAFFRKFKTTINSSLTNTSTSAVTITSTSAAKAGKHEVTVKQVATKAQLEASGSSGVIRGRIPMQKQDAEGDEITLDEGTTLEFTIDGKTRNIDISGTYSNAEDYRQALETKINNEFGTGYDMVNGKVKVALGDDGETLTFEGVNGATKLSVYDEKDVFFFENTTNTINKSKDLEGLASFFRNKLTFTKASEDDADGELDHIRFSINGKEFSFDKETTLKAVMDTINNDETINATMEIDSTSGKVRLYSDNTGASEKLEIEDLGTSNFFEALGFDTSQTSRGTDTLATVDGIEIARTANTFTVDGITYQANKVTEVGETVEINLETDTEEIFESIKTFIEDYNEIVSYIEQLPKEKADRDYNPLVDDEKNEMTEDQIEKWENKAKVGLLSNDSILNSLARELRSTFNQKVEGVSLTFSDIGIKTGKYYNGGKIMLDESCISKLKSAISNDLDSVVALFTQKSSSFPQASNRTMNLNDRQKRFSEEGFMNRVYDTLEDYISTYRDSSNKKGKLLERAGMEGDTSELTNVLSKQLLNYDKRLSDLQRKLDTQYDRYYKKFAGLESAMNSLNSQSSYIAQMLGGGTQQ